MAKLSRRGALAGAAGLVLATPHIARAAVRQVKLGQSSGPGSPPGIACETFAAAVAAHPQLQSVLHVSVKHGGQLGDDLSMLHDIVDGTLELAVCGTTVVSSVVPEIGMMDTPFLFVNAASARAVLDGPIGAGFAELLKPKHINLQAWSENGLRHMTANKPIRSPADLAGLKLRVPQSAVMLAAFKTFGADAKALPLPQLREALRTGDFDAQENPVGLIESAKLYEVQKVLSLTSHIYSCNLIIASDDLLEDLNEAQRAALRECGTKAAAASRAAADAAQRDGVGRLQGFGMTVVSDIDTAAFQTANKPNIAALEEKFGADRVRALAAAGKVAG